MAQRRGTTREREVENQMGHPVFDPESGAESEAIHNRLDRVDLLPDEFADPNSTDMLSEIMQLIEQLAGGEGTLNRRTISEETLQAAEPEDYPQVRDPRPPRNR